MNDRATDKTEPQTTVGYALTAADRKQGALKFAARLKQLMARDGVRNTDLARMIGLSSSSPVTNWLKGTTTPEGPNARKLADVFSVNVEWLMHGIGDQLRRDPPVGATENIDPTPNAWWRNQGKEAPGTEPTAPATDAAATPPEPEGTPNPPQDAPPSTMSDPVDKLVVAMACVNEIKKQMAGVELFIDEQGALRAKVARIL